MTLQVYLGHVCYVFSVLVSMERSRTHAPLAVWTWNSQWSHKDGPLTATNIQAFFYWHNYACCRVLCSFKTDFKKVVEVIHVVRRHIALKRHNNCDSEIYASTVFSDISVQSFQSIKIKKYKNKRLKKKLNLRWQTNCWSMSLKVQNVVSSQDSNVSTALLMLVSFYTEPWTSTNWRLFLLIYSSVSIYTICK